MQDRRRRRAGQPELELELQRWQAEIELASFAFGKTDWLNEAAWFSSGVLVAVNGRLLPMSAGGIGKEAFQKLLCAGLSADGLVCGTEQRS
jgi:hypothetical protein